MTPNIEYDAPQLNLCIPQGNIAIKPDTKTVKFINDLFGQTTIGTAALTERVANGTKILNPMWGDRMVVQVGYYFDTSENKLRIYSAFGSGSDVGLYHHFESLILYDRNSESEAYEFTIENAPSKSVISGASEMHKYRANFNVTVNPFIADIRFASVFYNADNEVMEVQYSAQYRYTVTDGVATRTLVETAPQRPDLVINAGLQKNASSIYKTFSYKELTETSTILPLVSTNEDLQYSFIVPDSFFTDQELGLRLVVVTGEGAEFRGPAVYKAKDTITLGSTTLTEQQLIALLELLN